MSRLKGLQSVLAKHKILTVALAIVSLFVVAALLGFARANKPVAAAPPPLEVEVIPVEQTNVPIYKEWIGTTDGMVNAEIKAQVTGGQNFRASCSGGPTLIHFHAPVVQEEIR